MTFRVPRLLWVLVLFCCGLAQAEKVADLPLPTSYVNDFAGVLSDQTKQDLENVCVQVNQKAKADLVVVTIKTLDDGQSIDEFTTALEEKWKFGKKGSDRSAIYLLVLSPHGRRVEVGYGLEGILNDAKVGGILDLGNDAERAGDYNGAVTASVDGLAQVIATDAQVQIDMGPVVHQYHRQPVQGQQPLGLGQIILGVIVIGVVIVLALTGNLGWAFVILQMFMGGGGGGGGGGRDDDEGGGGFGGMGGGSSGGGGASRDF